jgi:hypothetical protein
VSGVPSLLANLARIKEQALDRALEVSRSQAEDLLQASLILVPVDKGDLRNSGHVEIDEAGAQVVYDAPHAIYVHENLQKNHSQGQGQAKYLEQPLVEMQPVFARQQREEFERVISGG